MGTEIKASNIVRKKMKEQGGKITIKALGRTKYEVSVFADENYFYCDVLSKECLIDFKVFDVIVDVLIKHDGKATKGSGIVDSFGYGNCTGDTILGAIAKEYYGKQIGDKVNDSLYVLADILEWAGIVYNGYSYLTLTKQYWKS